MGKTFSHNTLRKFSILLILTPILHAASPNIVKSVPGFPGILPFSLETGYVGVGDNEEVQLFYYFIKSERNYERDPLMIWVTGGPGCSALSGLVLEIGPLNFNTSACNWHSEEPAFHLNPSSWTQIANVIFLDSPVGTGFSYATNPEGYYSDDITSSRHIYQFLRKWLMDHDGFQNNPLFISGDSYSGKIVPIVVQEISNGNKAGFQPLLNLQGYILGNPVTRTKDSIKSKYDYAHRVSLLSDDLYETTGAYNTPHMCCLSYKNLDPLFAAHVLLPKCISHQTWCQESIYYLLENWANDIQVRTTLHIREVYEPYIQGENYYGPVHFSLISGTKSSWIRCNKTLAYEENVESTFGYHQNLTRLYPCTDLQRSQRNPYLIINVPTPTSLSYYGDQDMAISYVDTLEWIKMLNVSISEDWRPWFVNGQISGYTTKFANDKYHVTFATVKGAGHTAPEYKRSECFTMLLKWFAMLPL